MKRERCGHGQARQTRVHPAETVVVAAALEAVRLGAIGFDVKQIAIARVENRPARLDLSAYPYLPAVTVAPTRSAAYLALLCGEAA